ncbi:MAG: phosphoglycolate phosphatase [Rhodobacteraceae bacterium]|nr:MAG: phosphoglycolate phosphatase [Paracoccaceae bacterium]
MPATIAFDLDGTLIHSVPQIAQSVNAGLADIGLGPLDEALVQGFVGRGLPKLVDQVLAHLGLPQDRFHDLHDRILAIYVTVPTPPSVIYPGARETLEALKAAGHPLALCTNKPHAATLTCLRDTGLAPFFDRVIGGDSLPTRKPDPAMLHAALNGATQALYVGDSETDAETAQAAKIPFLLYTEGYRKHPVDALPHTARFSHFADLPALVRASSVS